jgi:hypothetical protein
MCLLCVEGLGDGADTWAPQPGEPYTRVSYLRPGWPGRASVLAVERMGGQIDAELLKIFVEAEVPRRALAIAPA